MFYMPKDMTWQHTAYHDSMSDIGHRRLQQK